MGIANLAAPGRRPVLVFAAFACAAASNATLVEYSLHDHPDGAVSPPPYGLRMDGLFNGIAGAGVNATTTFSFNTYSVRLVYDTVASSITIAGTVFGGVDTGAGYGFGAGAYELSYTYTTNVQTMGTGYFIQPPSNGINQGTLTAHGGIAGIGAGTVFHLYESNSMGNPFKFLQDDHRLNIANGGSTNHPEAGQGFWVGRGWNTTHPDGSPPATTQDWLFIGKLAPLPTPLAMGGAGLAALLGARRRRA